MQKNTFLFQFLTGIVAGFFIHFALYGIGQLAGLVGEVFYLHNFFVVALLIKAFLFTRYRVFSYISILTCTIICVYYFYENPWLSYWESLVFSIIVIALLTLVAISSSNLKKTSLSYGLAWSILIALYFISYKHDNYQSTTVTNPLTIKYTTKSHYFNPEPFFLPMYYYDYDTSFVKIHNRDFTKADLKDKVTVMGFGSKEIFGFSYSLLYSFIKANRINKGQYDKSLQIILIDVGYYHTIEKTLNTKRFPCRANQEGSYIACDDSLFLFAHDTNAAFVKAMKFKPVPLVAVFNKEGNLVYEITEVENEQSAKIVSNLLGEVIKKELERK